MGWQRFAALAAVAGVAVVGTACTDARVGVGLPRAVIYQNTTVPMKLERNREGPPGPIPIPPDLQVGTCTAYALDFSVPTLEFTRPLSVGWGDMSLEAALADGNLSHMVYADAQQLVILGIFKRARVIVHGPTAGSGASTLPQPVPEGGQ